MLVIDSAAGLTYDAIVFSDRRIKQCPSKKNLDNVTHVCGQFGNLRKKDQIRYGRQDSRSGSLTA